MSEAEVTRKREVPWWMRVLREEPLAAHHQMWVHAVLLSDEPMRRRMIAKMRTEVKNIWREDERYWTQSHGRPFWHMSEAPDMAHGIEIVVVLLPVGRHPRAHGVPR